MSHTVSKESDYRGKQEEVVVLSVIIGEETEVEGVRTCLTWKPLSVLTLMGRLKQGRVRALSLPPAPPVSTVALSSAELQSGVWNTLQPPPPTPPPPLSRPLQSWCSCFSSSRSPNHLSLTPQTTAATTPIHPSPSPPTVQSGQALLHLTSLAGVEQRPTRHQDNETGVQWPRKGTPVCLCESEHGKCTWACAHVCTCVSAQP